MLNQDLREYRTISAGLKSTYQGGQCKQERPKTGGSEMPTILGKPFLTSWTGRPPHMLLPDVPVWYRFVEKMGGLFEKLYYDSFLGGPTLTAEEELDPMKRMWRANTAKRTDAIVETINEVWLIEVSNYPGMRAVGQLHTYQALWIEDPKIIKPEKMVLVCERLDTDIGAACGKFGFQVYVI